MDLVAKGVDESFRLFVSRNKGVSDRHKKNYLNFIKFTKQLSKTKVGDKKRLDKIKSAIQQSKNIADANWLYAKIEELQ